MFGKLLDNVDLPNQYDDTRVEGRILLYDADPLAYKSAATVKRLRTAISRFQTGVLEMMYLTKSVTAHVHLTHKDSHKAGRHLMKGIKPYQANRKGGAKPALLYDLRDAVILPENVLSEYSAWMHMPVEADDACMIDAYRFKDAAVLASEDKDLRQTPYLFYDNYRDEIIKAHGIGSLWEHVTPAGNMSPHGIGRIFFWAQMLMGDTADNVAGLQEYEGQRIGDVRTLEVLTPYNDTEDESEVANLVIDGYRKIDQNPYPEGYMLHMMRAWGDSFHHVVSELDWTVKNKKFLQECVGRDWFEQEAL